MTDAEHRAARLLSELEAWLLAEQITPPAYVTIQMDELKDALKEMP